MNIKRPNDISLKKYWKATSSMERVTIVENAFTYIEYLESTQPNKSTEEMAEEIANSIKGIGYNKDIVFAIKLKLQDFVNQSPSKGISANLFDFEHFHKAVKHAEKNKDATLGLILSHLADEVLQSLPIKETSVQEDKKECCENPSHIRCTKGMMCDNCKTIIEHYGVHDCSTCLHYHPNSFGNCTECKEFNKWQRK